MIFVFCGFLDVIIIINVEFAFLDCGFLFIYASFLLSLQIQQNMIMIIHPVCFLPVSSLPFVQTFYSPCASVTSEFLDITQLRAAMLAVPNHSVLYSVQPIQLLLERFSKYVELG